MADGHAIVLHCCCGPCASACVPVLKSSGREVTLLFANSNIDTFAEFEKRRVEAEKLAQIDGVRFAALPYDHEEWLREVAAGFEHEPERGARCARCFRYNLRKAAAFAQANGIPAFTTSLSVSPQKVSSMIFAAGNAAAEGAADVRFESVDFKRDGGSARSVHRATELGLYRQTYCGCEFSKFRWRIFRRAETDSTNLDARAGAPGDVFTADFQRAGRGRLDHRWTSAPGENLMMSVVLSVAELDPAQVATLPLVAGLSVAKAVDDLSARSGKAAGAQVKWPNDVLVGGRKIAGILCELNGDRVIVGIGVNVRQREWPSELCGRALSLAELTGRTFKIAAVRQAVLDQLGKWQGLWRERGFEVIRRDLAEIDFLKGRLIEVRRTDDDARPVRGVCDGIASDGALLVAGESVYAGEAHVTSL